MKISSMKNSLLLPLLAFGLFGTTAAQMTNETLTVGSATRQFRQYLPSGFDSSTEPGLPLVIAMHGLGDDYINFSNVGFQFLADTARFIVVYPNGTTNSFGQNSWNNGTLLSSAADDNGFLSRLIDSMYVRHHIDLAKVYVTGFSMGGIMTYHALCALPERIAAIASVAGTMSSSDLGACNPGRAVPVMHMHGTADGTVPYSGGLPSLTSVPQTIGFWQGNNTCTDSSVTSMPDLVPADSITIDVLNYNLCSEPLQFWRENNADHQWLYYPANDITATIEIWNFFRGKTHPSPSMLGLVETNQPANTSITANATGFEILSDLNIEEITVTDLQGRTIYSRKGNFGTNFQVNLNGSREQVLIASARAGKNWCRKKIVLLK